MRRQLSRFGDAQSSGNAMMYCGALKVNPWVVSFSLAEHTDQASYTPLLPWLPCFPLQHFAHLVLPPGDGLFDRSPSHRLCSHVRQDVVILNDLDVFVRLRRPAACTGGFSLFGKEGGLGILVPDGMRFIVVQWGLIKAEGGGDPGIEVLLRIEVAEELFAQLDVLREVPDP